MSETILWNVNTVGWSADKKQDFIFRLQDALREAHIKIEVMKEKEKEKS